MKLNDILNPIRVNINVSYQINSQFNFMPIYIVLRVLGTDMNLN